MKSIVLIFFLIFVQVKTEAQSTSQHTQFEDMSWNVANTVERYFYTYFEYPHNMEDIECYLWSIINGAITNCIIEPINECQVTNLQYQDFVTSANSFINTLKYLKYNEKDIIIKIENNSFNLRCLNDALFVNYTADICWDLNNPQKSKLFRHYQRLFFYDKNKKIIESPKCDSILAQRIKDIRDCYYQNYSEKEKSKGKVQYVLIKYTKGEKRFKSLCPSGEKYLKHSFLKQIFKSLNICFKDREVCSAVLLLPILLPEE